MLVARLSRRPRRLCGLLAKHGPHVKKWEGGWLGVVGADWLEAVGPATMGRAFFDQTLATAV